MKERFIIVLLAVVVFAVAYLAHAKNAGEDTQKAELLSPQDYCEYIESLELYIQFLEDEIDRLDDAYIGDVIIEADEYWDYQEAANKFYGVQLPLNKEEEAQQ